MKFTKYERDRVVDAINIALDSFQIKGSDSDAWKTIRDKLQQGYGLCSMEEHVLKKWLLDPQSLIGFSISGRLLLRGIASKLSLWTEDDVPGKDSSLS